MFEDAEQLIAAWNGRQARRIPMLFSSTIGAALASRHWYLWVRASPVTQHSLSTCGRLIGLKCSRGKPHPRSVLPPMSAERAVR